MGQAWCTAAWADRRLGGSIFVAVLALTAVAEPEACGAASQAATCGVKTATIPLPEFSKLARKHPKKALSHVQLGRINVTGTVPAKKGQLWIVLDVMASYLQSSARKSGQMLELLTAMFQAGANPNAVSRWFHNGRSAVWVAVERGDVSLCRCLVQAGAKIADEAALLRMLAFNWAGSDRDTFIKDLFKLQNKFRGSSTAAATEHQVKNASHLIDQSWKLASIYMDSVTVQRAVSNISDVSLNYPLKIAQDIDADILDGLLEEIRQAKGFDFGRGLVASTTGHTIFHISATGSPRATSSFVKLAIESGNKTVRSTLKALHSKDMLGRTAFHVAAIRFGTNTNEASSAFGALLQGSKKLSQLLGLPWQPKDIMSKQDALKVSVANYAASSKKTVDRDKLKEYTEKLSGGWTVSQNAKSDARSNWCDVLVLSSPVEKETFRELILSGKPAKFRREALNYAIRKKLTKLSFLKKHGSVQINAAAIPYSSKFGMKEDVMTLREFVERTKSTDSETPPYIFEQDVVQKNSALQKEFEKMPPIMQDVSILGEALYMEPLQFYLGPRSSGAPMHFHKDAVNILAFGRKKWFLFPPKDAFYSQQHPLVWNRSARAGALSQPWECTQDGGDILFVPANWAHATVNLQESIGVAYEFAIPGMSAIAI